MYAGIAEKKSPLSQTREAGKTREMKGFFCLNGADVHEASAAQLQHICHGGKISKHAIVAYCRYYIKR